MFNNVSFKLILFSILFFLASPALAQERPISFPQLIEAGAAAAKRGDFAKAVLSYERVAGSGGSAGDIFYGRLRLGEAYQSLGRIKTALEIFQTLLSHAEQTGDKKLIATAMSALGAANMTIGVHETAGKYLNESLRIAQSIDDSALISGIQNHIGELYILQKQDGEACGWFTRSASSAKLANDGALYAKALVNAAKTCSDGRVDMLDAAIVATQSLENSHEKAFLLISIALIFSDSGDQTGSRPLAILDQAAAVAESINDDRALSYALGYMGEILEKSGRYDAALGMTRKALFHAQIADDPNALYMWNWQTGRIVKTSGDFDEAINAYRRSATQLKILLSDAQACSDETALKRRKKAEPMLLEFIDLLLRRSAQFTDPNQTERYLIEARKVAETLKQSQIKEYFQDECVASVKGKDYSLEQAPKGTAVIYTIILPDRLELLVGLPNGMRRYTVAASNQAVISEVRSFREYLEKRTTREYLPHAMLLYDWLIRPMEKDLMEAKVDTLVFAPDSHFRTIPLAALYDGHDFLITKYAVATTPGLSFTEPKPFKRDNAKILLAGLTEPSQGFLPLPYVSQELSSISGIGKYRSLLLKDTDFTIPNIQNDIGKESFSIVHIASHGKFESDYRKTFLLTFDGKLTIDRLEEIIEPARFRDTQVDLLTLSACQTAVGDDRAALGLAGVALKAGAKSALASLWFINDAAASILVEKFYRELSSSDISKAEALRQAQMELIKDRRYRHPGYWSAFLLIGSWL